MHSSTSTPISIDLRVFQAMPGNSIVLLPDTPAFTIVAATDGYYTTSGRTEEELIGMGIFEAFPNPPDDPDHKGINQLLTSLEKVLHQKNADRMPLVRYDIENADGSFDELYWSALNKPVLAENGEILYIIHTAEEITSQVEAEHSANRIKSLEKSNNLFIQAPVAIGIAKGRDYIIELANDSLLEVWGRTAEEVIGKPLFDAVPDLKGQGFKELMDGVCTSGQPFYGYEHPLRINRKGKEELHYFDFVYKPYYEGGAKPVGVFTIGHNVTEQVLSKRKVFESEAKLRSILNSAPTAIGVFVGPDLILENPNQLMIDIMAAGPDIEGKSFRKLLTGLVEEDQNFLHLIDTVRSTGKAFEAQEVEVFFKDESRTRYFNINFIPLFDENQSVYAVLDVSVEVTEQVVVRRKLEQSQERLSDIINQVNAGIAQATVDGQFISANERYCQLVGYTEEELQALTIKSLTHPDDWARNEELMVEAVKEGKNFFIEKRYIRKDGVMVWVNNSVSIVTNSKGEKFVTTISVDITEQVTNRQKLEESEGRFRLLADASPNLIWMLKPDGGYGYVNKTTLEFLGVTQEQIAAVGWEPFQHPEDLVAATETLQAAIKAKMPYQMEHRMRHKDGEYRWVLSHSIPAYDATGNVFAYVGSSIDIDEAKRNRQQLVTALEQIRLSKEAAELGTFDLDLESGTMHWDDRCRILFGISHHNRVTYEHDFVNGLHPDDRERITKLIDGLFDKSISNGDYDVEYRTVGAEDGVVRWVRAKGKVYFNEKDKPARFIGSVLDITEKMMAIQQIEKLVEERTKELADVNESLVLVNRELQRSNANLEEFAHAASHDLKEPVRKIHFFTSQLKKQLSDHLSETETRSFNRIENATERMGNLIDDLLLYSHVSHRPHEMESVDLNKKVRNAMEDLELDIEEKKAVIHVGELPIVQGYRRQLQQLFQNLISNALKYSKADVPPIIKIVAQKVEKSDKFYYLISVEDNGIGFEQEYANKIFQMFTRLHGKAEYSGTGVGLSIVKKVVENHNGWIKAESVAGEGSVFKIYLPVEP